MSIESWRFEPCKSVRKMVSTARSKAPQRYYLLRYDRLEWVCCLNDVQKVQFQEGCQIVQISVRTHFELIERPLIHSDHTSCRFRTIEMQS